jgi:hypothetical protein
MRSSLRDPIDITDSLCWAEPIEPAAMLDPPVPWLNNSTVGSRNTPMVLRGTGAAAWRLAGRLTNWV